MLERNMYVPPAQLAGEQVLGASGREQPGRDGAGIAGDQHRQPGDGAVLAVADGHGDVGEPQIALADLVGLVGGSQDRVGGYAGRRSRT